MLRTAIVSLCFLVSTHVRQICQWTLVNTLDGTIVDSTQIAFRTESRRISVNHIAVMPGATYILTVLDE